MSVAMVMHYMFMFLFHRTSCISFLSSRSQIYISSAKTLYSVYFFVKYVQKYHKAYNYPRNKGFVLEKLIHSTIMSSDELV